MWETRVGYTSPCTLQNCIAQNFIYIYIYEQVHSRLQDITHMFIWHNRQIIFAAMQWKDSNSDLSSASCTQADVACMTLVALFFKASSPSFTTLCRRWHLQQSQSHWRVVLKALATLPPQSVTVARKSTCNLNKCHCSTASLAMTVRTQQYNN